MPFLAALPLIARVLSAIFGGAGKGAADQRLAENQNIAQKNALLASLYGTQQEAQTRALEGTSNEASRQGTLGLGQNQLQQDERKFALDAPAARGQQTVRGSLMQNLQPASISGLPSKIQANIPQLHGGSSPEAFSPEVRQMGAQLQRNAILGQLKGDPIDQFAPMTKTDFSSGLLTPPTLTDPQKPGMLENITGGGGLIASILAGILDPALANRRIGYGSPSTSTTPDFNAGIG